MSSRRGADHPTILTIPPSLPFLATLAEHLHTGGFGITSSLDLADSLILMPNRRAARALQKMLRDTAPSGASLLPSIRAIGDAPEDEQIVTALPIDETDLANSAVPTSHSDLPPAIGSLERRLVLMRMVLAFGRTVARELFFPDASEHLLIPVGPADALALADGLADLFDRFAIEEVAPEGIRGIVPDIYAGYWSISLRFLDIVIEQWPRYLEAAGKLDPAARRSLLIRREADWLEHARPDHPIIIAGSTGSIPATAKLMQVVSQLPRGAVVLPGLDQHLDDASWTAIDAAEASDPGNPQFGLKQLIGRLGVTREEVIELVSSRVSRRPARERLISEVMRPATTCDLWQGRRPIPEDLDDALTGVSLLVAETDYLEARAIGVLMRQAPETSDKRAVLVTPDRTLSRRVAQELARWGIVLPDTAGRPLSGLPAGVFVTLVADAVSTRFAPAELAALLKHPLFRPWLSEHGRLEHARTALELIVLRGPRPSAGPDGLMRSFKRMIDERETWRHPVLTRLSDRDIADAQDLIAVLETAVMPLTTALSGDRAVSLAELMDATLVAAETLCRSGEDATGLYDRRDGAALAGLADTLAGGGHTDREPSLARTWPVLLRQLLADVTVRPADPDLPLAIWGPLEGRLQAPDLLIVGGLNEGTWPSEPEIDPWLSRGMRQALGLAPPERQIGLAAHDIAQAFASPEVVLSRSVRAGGTPMVASRWLQRLETVIGPERSAALEARSRPALIMAEQLSALDQGGERRDVVPPQPVRALPPVPARPRRFSVTDVETLIRDPYALYCRRILDLAPLDELDADADAATRGSLVHDVLADLVTNLPDDIETITPDMVLAAAEPHLARFADMPEVRALWLPRLRRLARFFADWETGWRMRRARSLVETSGWIEVDAPEGGVTLTARADRIDQTHSGALALFDYKTGQAPSAKAVLAGLQPQLTLEAAIARAGGFPGLDVSADAPVARLSYVKLSGGLPPGDIVDIAPKDGSLDDLADSHLAGFRALIAAYDRPDQPYLAKPRVAFRDQAGDYDHLSRFADWRDLEGG
ncbi:MAG: double-strand break repair protein AddB [Pseudomonadota bacterium]